MSFRSGVNGRLAGLLVACAVGTGGASCAAFAANTASTAATSENGVTADTILLGQSAALSGPTAGLGKQMNAGARLYFEQINQQGGIYGRKIRIEALDDYYEPEPAASNTKKLIEEDRVFALFGYVGTPTSQAALPLAIQAKVPFFGPYTGARTLREPRSRYVFHVRAGYNEEATAILRQIQTTGLKRVAVVYNDDAYGKAELEELERALKAASNSSVQLVAREGVVRNTSEIGDAMQGVMKAKPDAW